MNLELADRFIPAYCSISIIKWSKGEKVDEIDYLLNPETPIEKFLSNKHGIYNKDVYNLESIRDVWHEVYDFIEGEIVVIDNANSFMKSFKKRCLIDGLKLPNFKYICLRSMFNKNFKGEKNFKVNIPGIKNFLGIKTPNYNSYEDALAMKNIIDFILYYNEKYKISELYDENDFIIGEVIDNNILDKKTIKEKYKKGGFFNE